MNEISLFECVIMGNNLPKKYENIQGILGLSLTDLCSAIKFVMSKEICYTFLMTSEALVSCHSVGMYPAIRLV